MTQYLRLINGVRQLAQAVISSTGTVDASRLIATDSTGRINSSLIRQLNLSSLASNLPLTLPGGRLTVSSIAPVADGAVSTLYYLPYQGALIPILHNGLWRAVPINATTFSLTNQAAGVYDLYPLLSTDGQGTYSYSLAGVAWTNPTTRATSLIQQDGIWVLDFGASDRRTYLGTVRNTGGVGNQFVDEPKRRFVYNAWNQVAKPLRWTDPTETWTYNSTTWRPWNNSLANRIEVVAGVNRVLDASFDGLIEIPNLASIALAIALDSPTNPTQSVFLNTVGLSQPNLRHANEISAGYHYLQAFEFAANAVCIFYGGTNYGFRGVWTC